MLFFDNVHMCKMYFDYSFTHILPLISFYPIVFLFEKKMQQNQQIEMSFNRIAHGENPFVIYLILGSFLIFFFNYVCGCICVCADTHRGQKKVCVPWSHNYRSGFWLHNVGAGN